MNLSKAADMEVQVSTKDVVAPGGPIARPAREPINWDGPNSDFDLTSSQTQIHASTSHHAASDLFDNAQNIQTHPSCTKQANNNAILCIYANFGQSLEYKNYEFFPSDSCHDFPSLI